MRTTHSRLAALCSVAIGVSTIGVIPAWAASSPDDGLYVATKGHIDSPKTFWEGNTFVLKSEAHEKLRPLESTVNWVGKGWSKNGRAQQYQWQMPDDPAIDVLKQHGDRWYQAPATPLGTDPIWAGFGADQNIPTEKFRDAVFTLDIVGFDGPGRMELFNYSEGNLNRLLSSHDTGLRSFFLEKGEHSHNTTLFTKPGRYIVTYRTTARDKETGKIIAAKETPLVWQVGGESPAAQKSAPLIDRFAAAKDAAPKTPYTFSIQEHTGRDRDGDNQLTDFVFDAHDASVTGSLAILIDGFHLTEIPVKGGKAVWPEYLGSGTSQYQAVFIPSDGESPRWASELVSYRFGGNAVQTTSERFASELAKPVTQDPASAFSKAEYTPKDYGFTVTSKPVSDEYFETTVQLNDAAAHVQVTGGYYENDEAKKPECLVSGVTDATGKLTVKEDIDSCEGYKLKLTVNPHPLLRADSTTVIGSSLLDPKMTLTTAGKLGTYSGPAGAETPSDPSDQPTNPADKPSDPSDQPTNPADKPNVEPDTPAEPEQPKDGILREPTVLTHGHVDIQARLGNRLTAVVRDDTMQHAAKSVDRSISSIALGLDNSTRTKRPKSGPLSKPAADFLPTSFYYVDQNWDRQHVWPGWSTTGIDGSRIGARGGTAGASGNLTLTLSPHTIPEGSAYHAFTVEGLTGTINHMIDSAANRTSVEMPVGTHQHATWVFTKPGAYLLNAGYSGVVDGKQVSTTPECLTFLVGNEAINEFKLGKSPKCATGGPVVTTPSAPSAIDNPAAPNASNSANWVNSTSNVSAPAAASSNRTAVDVNAGRQAAGSTEAKPEVKKVCTATTKLGGSHTIPANTHVHPNWVFTKEGSYTVRVTETATLKDGTKVTAPLELKFNVGGKGTANEGHYDIGAQVNNGKLVAAFKDPNEKWNTDFSNLTFGLGDASKATAPAGIEFIAKEGETVWMVSSTQVSGVPWIGANTMHESVLANTTGDVTWTLDKVEGPGALAVFTSGNLGAVVGDQWFGGVTESCGYVDANGHPIDLANTGFAGSGLMPLASAMVAAGGIAVTIRRRRVA